MSTLTEEIVEICAAMPEETVAEVVKFARALQQTGETGGDAIWERIIATAAPRPRLEEFMRLAFADGADEPLDSHRL